MKETRIKLLLEINFVQFRIRFIPINRKLI